LVICGFVRARSDECRSSSQAERSTGKGLGNGGAPHVLIEQTEQGLSNVAFLRAKKMRHNAARRRLTAFKVKFRNTEVAVVLLLLIAASPIY
jgi:hypothetical protein